MPITCFNAPHTSWDLCVNSCVMFSYTNQKKTPQNKYCYDNAERQPSPQPFAYPRNLTFFAVTCLRALEFLWSARLLNLEHLHLHTTAVQLEPLLLPKYQHKTCWPHRHQSNWKSFWFGLMGILAIIFSFKSLLLLSFLPLTLFSEASIRRYWSAM